MGFPKEMKTVGPTSIQNGSGETTENISEQQTIQREIAGKTRTHQNDGENASKQQLQKPNTGIQTGKILVNGERKRKRIYP